jgi:hypothetical protein
MYASFLRISRALHLHIFQQPPSIGTLRTREQKKMKNARIGVLLLAALFLWAGAAYAVDDDEDRVIHGKVIEFSKSPGERYLQVGDQNFKVILLLIDRGGEMPVLASWLDLEEGINVEIHVGAEGEDFWEASRVIILPKEEDQRD